MIRAIVGKRVSLRTAITELSLAGWVALLLLLGYWQVIQDRTVYYNENITAESPVRRGGTLVLHSSFCQRYPVVPGTVVRTIHNDFVYVLADTGAVIEPGCYSVRREVRLPDSMMLGPHTYNFEATFQVNPIKRVTGHIKPVPFEVIP